MYFTKFDKDKEITGKLKLTPVVTDFEADYEVSIRNEILNCSWSFTNSHKNFS